MQFAPDTEESLEFAVALGNTVAGASRSGNDELATTAQLTELLSANRYSGRFDRDETELREVHEMRARVRRMWMLGRDDAVVEVNAMLRDAAALPQLVRHDDQDWHLHATPPDARLAERIGVEFSIALIDVIRTSETGRLRGCAADDCEGLLLDLSRNGSKRFCSIRCGNRVNMIAFRERTAVTSD